ncbi:MAG TPA: hypothetical protein VMS11_01050 [Solirubrobacterales bacterium]|nr:hypothetical protein [Solirubrobacterales bacterium]
MERQSVLLTSERRMGKTSVMRRMTIAPPIGTCPVKRSLQGLNTPEEFARALVADVEANLPGLLSRPILKRLRKAGVKKVGAKSVEVEFEPVSEEAWKEVVIETLETVDSGVDERVVFFWDEVPHMIEAINRERGAGTARDMLDVLRFVRETYASVRMVFSGSLGIHHVIEKLRLQGGMWVPAHDMAMVDVPPLAATDATFLALELLQNEGIECDDPAGVAAVVAAEVDCVPFYVHHTVAQMQQWQEGGGGLVGVATAREVIEAVLGDPLDPWQLKHYVDRVPVYYPDQVELSFAVLDAIASAQPLDQVQIEEHLAAQGKPPGETELHDLLELLCKDHYIEPGYDFRLSLVRRAWRARRPPR